MYIMYLSRKVSNSHKIVGIPVSDLNSDINIYFIFIFYELCIYCYCYIFFIYNKHVDDILFYFVHVLHDCIVRSFLIFLLSFIYQYDII